MLMVAAVTNSQAIQPLSIIKTQPKKYTASANVHLYVLLCVCIYACNGCKFVS